MYNIFIQSINIHSCLYRQKIVVPAAVTFLFHLDRVWLLGDDDLLHSGAISELSSLLSEHKSCDFFYVNASHLTTEYVLSFNQPFDIVDLPDDMELFSKKKHSEEIPFLKLIDPHVSFDFLGGMFLSVFRRKNWMDNVNVLNADAINDCREFSYYDNTFPHVKIFSKFARNCLFAADGDICHPGGEGGGGGGDRVTSLLINTGSGPVPSSRAPIFRPVWWDPHLWGWSGSRFKRILVFLAKNQSPEKAPIET